MYTWRRSRMYYISFYPLHRTSRLSFVCFSHQNKESGLCYRTIEALYPVSCNTVCLKWRHNAASAAFCFFCVEKKKPECRSYFNWGSFSFYSLSWRSENSWNNTEDFGGKGSLMKASAMTSALWSVRHISLENKGQANYPCSPEEQGALRGAATPPVRWRLNQLPPPVKLVLNCWVTFPGVGDSTKGIVGKRCSSNPTCADGVFGVSAGCVLHV